MGLIYKSSTIPKSGLGDRIGYYIYLGTISNILNIQIITAWDYVLDNNYARRGSEYPENIHEYISFPTKLIFVDINKYNNSNIKLFHTRWVDSGFDLVPETQYRMLIEDKVINCTFKYYMEIYNKTVNEIKYLKPLPDYNNFSAIHIRRGDFTLGNKENTEVENNNLIKLIKKIKNKADRWVIFSDDDINNYKELTDILSNKLISINNYSNNKKIRTLEEFFILIKSNFIVQSIPPNTHTTYPNQFSSYSYIPSIINNKFLYTTALKHEGQRFIKMEKYSKIMFKNIKYLSDII